MLEITDETAPLFDKILVKSPGTWDVANDQGQKPIDLVDPAGKHGRRMGQILNRIFQDLWDVNAGKDPWVAIKTLLKDTIKSWFFDAFVPKGENRIDTNFIPQLTGIDPAVVKTHDRHENNVLHYFFQLEPPAAPTILDKETKEKLEQQEKVISAEADLLMAILKGAGFKLLFSENLQHEIPLELYYPKNNKYVAPLLLKKSLGTKYYVGIKKYLSKALLHALATNDLETTEKLIIVGCDPVSTKDDHDNCAAHIFFNNAHISDESIKKWRTDQKKYVRVASLIIRAIEKNNAWDTGNNKGQTIFSLFRPEKNSNTPNHAAHSLIEERVLDSAYGQLMTQQRVYPASLTYAQKYSVTSSMLLK